VKIDWNEFSITSPKILGKQVLKDIPLSTLVEVIDWTFFFNEWGLSGRWPGIASDPVFGKQAKELYDNAQVIIKEIIDQKLITVQGVYGFWRAVSEKEQVELLSENGAAIAKLHFLRNQEAERQTNPCLADFIAPKSSGKEDFMGLFTVVALMDEEKIKHYVQADDYHLLIIRILANRFAEATAEYLHFKVRTDDWGYVNEPFDAELMLKEKYQGIRPAPGYPACPDHSEKVQILKLLDAEREIGVKLTENFMVQPVASVCGYYFANPQATYFNVGKISKDQVEEYARNKGLDVKTVEKLLAENV
jgi:5-methyltetrahydrofolate--homocysteine methyltransferase